MGLTRRALLHQPSQLIATLLGVGLSVMLVIVLLGVLSGVRQQTADYLTTAPGPVVAASSGTENFLMVAVPLPTDPADAVRAAPGVAEAVPLLSRCSRGCRCEVFEDVEDADRLVAGGRGWNDVG